MRRSRRTWPLSLTRSRARTRSPGSGRVAAAIIIAEIGVDMTRFPTSGHLASWAKFAPGINASAGKETGNGTTGHGNRYLARVLGETAITASRSDTFLGARYRRIARRRGKKKAIVATGRSQLVIIWHLLSTPDASYHDLGADHYDRHVNPDAKTPKPHPKPGSPRLQGHPRTRGLTNNTRPIRLRCAPPDAAACLVTAILGLGRPCRPGCRRGCIRTPLAGDGPVRVAGRRGGGAALGAGISHRR